MWQQEGKTFTAILTFRDAHGTAVIPDVGTVYLTALDNEGDVIAGYDNLLQEPGGNQLQVSIPGGENTISGSNVVENRFVQVTYQVSGTSFQVDANYHLTPFIPMSATADQVRALTGLTVEELPTSEVDLYQAYYNLNDVLVSVKTSSLTLKDYLISGTVKSLKANQALAIQAALDIAPSIPNRIAATQKSQDAEFTRNSKIDPNRLAMDLLSQRDSLIDSLITADASVAQTRVLFAVTAPTDVITGA